MTKNIWLSIAPRILKRELLMRRLKYHDLKENLREIGVLETEQSIRNKLSRGSFNVVFFLQCLHAIGVKNLYLDETLFEGTENFTKDTISK